MTLESVSKQLEPGGYRALEVKGPSLGEIHISFLSDLSLKGTSSSQGILEIELKQKAAVS